MKKGGAVIEKGPVVNDGRVITANGPLAANEFGEAIVNSLEAPIW